MDQKYDATGNDLLDVSTVGWLELLGEPRPADRVRILDLAGIAGRLRSRICRLWAYKQFMMTRRSRAREVALQLLFQRDVNPNVSRSAIEKFVRDRLSNPEAEAFCLALFDGVTQNLADIDKQLTTASDNWKLQRMAASDRNVLRLGAYEIVYSPQPTPGPVALDEAIELARRYGTGDSGAFVNGVLDKVFHLHTGQPITSETPAPVCPTP
jgi:transcription antitermination protein NusB